MPVRQNLPMTFQVPGQDSVETASERSKVRKE